MKKGWKEFLEKFESGSIGDDEVWFHWFADADTLSILKKKKNIFNCTLKTFPDHKHLRDRVCESNQMEIHHVYREELKCMFGKKNKDSAIEWYKPYMNNIPIGFRIGSKKVEK